MGKITVDTGGKETSTEDTPTPASCSAVSLSIEPAAVQTSVAVPEPIPRTTAARSKGGCTTAGIGTFCVCMALVLLAFVCVMLWSRQMTGKTLECEQSRNKGIKDNDCDKILDDVMGEMGGRTTEEDDSDNIEDNKFDRERQK
uniref:Uncharacterized protein n=1 Tax=Branchiostoma floridae TaxID=7739 RepID=C3Y6I7_BRAFL|eukprot:XP_002607937.1 hypothetical protein BRAFLDRAFT_74887 [Branchiostoma floridae]